MFIDANVFIYALTTQDGKGKKSRALLERVIKGEQQASTSPLVMNEVLFFFLRRDRQIALDTWKKLFSIPNLEMLPVDLQACRFVPDFISAGLRPNDAFHVSVMKSRGISTICSFDTDFDKVAPIKRQEPK